MAAWVIEKLAKHHDRGPFSCGNSALDLFLKTLVGQYAKKRLGQTYVATAPESARVLGFYTASAGSILLDAVPEAARTRLSKHPVPTMHLGRLAVEVGVQRTGLGRTLLFHFLYHAVIVAEQIGVHAIDVFAKDDSSRAFYERYGFTRLEDDARHLYLPMATVEQMFGAAEIARLRAEINLAERMRQAIKGAARPDA